MQDAKQGCDVVEFGFWKDRPGGREATVLEGREAAAGGPEGRQEKLEFERDSVCIGVPFKERPALGINQGLF